MGFQKKKFDLGEVKKSGYFEYGYFFKFVVKGRRRRLRGEMKEIFLKEDLEIKKN